jgi:endoglucanase
LQGTDSDGPTLLFAAHQDEIGFMVSEITAEGFLRFVPIGGWNPATLGSSAVEVINQHGTSIAGIIGQIPLHFLAKSDEGLVPSLDQMFIDIGASNSGEVQHLFHVAVGDYVVPATRFVYHQEKETLMSKALDDRLGVAALIELSHLLVRQRVKANVTLLFTVQEEVGTRGAKVAANYVQADAAVVVEGAPADDVPSFKGNAQTQVGKGAHVRLYDPTHIANRSLVQLVRSAASARNIVIQEAVRKGGGTDAMALSLAGRGIPSFVCGVPVRYAHSHNNLCSLYDYQQLRSLLFALCQDIGKLN